MRYSSNDESLDEINTNQDANTYIENKTKSKSKLDIKKKLEEIFIIQPDDKYLDSPSSFEHSDTIENKDDDEKEKRKIITDNRKSKSILKISGLEMDKTINLTLGVCCTSCNNTKYFFRLKCPILVKLTNDCCNLDPSIVIPKCFEVGHTLFKIECPEHISFRYMNLEKHQKINDNFKPKDSNGYYVLELETSSDLECNTLCIEKLIIQVKCLSKIRKCEHSAKIGKLVYTEKKT
jgi:hypothetical protein